MPLPTPNQGENRDAFIARCMADAVVAEEFPDAEQRASVAANLFDRADDMDRAALRLAAGMPLSASTLARFRSSGGGAYSWDAEVFAVGTWNGMRFTSDDLDKIVASFEALNAGGYLDAPLKFGHNDEQPMTDGTPALGWVEKLYRQGDKLLARFADVPKLVYDAVKAKRYRKVSIELDFDVRHKGALYPYVLTGVALLGADLPAVNTLKDLTAYMSRDLLVASRRACFSAIANSDPNEEGPTMATIDDKELEELRRKAAQTDTLAGENAQFKADKAAREEAERKAGIKAAREKVNGLLDQAVTDMRIQPAQRAGFSKLLRVDDDEAVVGIRVEDVEAVLPPKPTAPAAAAFSASGQPPAGDPGKDSDDEIDGKVNKLMLESGGKLTYTAAYERVLAANPDLAKKHLLADAG